MANVMHDEKDRKKNLWECAACYNNKTLPGQGPIYYSMKALHYKRTDEQLYFCW
jgi:hypothetical protein